MKKLFSVFMVFALVLGLSVHYSGGNSLPDDVAEWLESNGINGSGRQGR